MPPTLDLRILVAQGDVARLSQLLRNPAADVNAHDVRDGSTLLHLAASRNHACLEALLKVRSPCPPSRPPPRGLRKGAWPTARTETLLEIRFLAFGLVSLGFSSWVSQGVSVCAATAKAWEVYGHQFAELTKPPSPPPYSFFLGFPAVLDIHCFLPINRIPSGGARRSDFQFNAKCDAVDYEGSTPLHVAAALGNAEAVSLLLSGL
jgi:ankyrin repeat protein